MEIIGNNQQISEPTIATIGNFDGVHRGHQYILSLMCDEATRRHMKTLLVTFTNSPKNYLSHTHTPLLSTPIEKSYLLAEHTNIDYLLTLPFDHHIATLTTEQFMTYLRKQYAVETLYIGYNSTFGSDGQTSLSHYTRIGEQIGIQINQTPPYQDPDTPSDISSTIIRQHLQNGNLQLANHLLGYNYLLTGNIVSGNQIGRQIGYPTANLQTDPRKLIPLNGVYGGEITIGDTHHPCLINIGNRPTIGGTTRTIETHILNYQGNLYGQHLAITLTTRLRDEQQFATLDHLRQQIEKDIRTLQKN